MDLQNLSANLRRLRTARGLTQLEAAEVASLSRIGYRNIEAGLTAPRFDTIGRLATALGVKVEELFSPTNGLSAVRFRSAKKMGSRSEIVSSVALWLAEYNELEALLDDRINFGLELIRDSASRQAGSERSKNIAEQSRTAMGLDPKDVVRDICVLLEKQGIKVYTPKLASEGFFGLSVASEEGGPLIVVNTWERLSVERWIFTAAHELGHLLLHLDAYDISRMDEEPVQEKEADSFASHFLMPEELFKEKLEESIGLPLVKVVFKLKRFFGVSWKSVLYRISTIYPNAPNLWGRFQSEYRATAKRTIAAAEEPDPMDASGFGPVHHYSVVPPAKVTDEPEHLIEGDFIGGRLHQLVHKALDQNVISKDRGAELLGVEVEALNTISWAN